VNTSNTGQKEVDGPGFVEFAANDVPRLLAQSGRAGARLDQQERYVAINPAFRSMLDSTLREGVGCRLADVWDARTCQQLLRPALERCRVEGMQIIQGCQLRDDPWPRSFEIYLVPEEGSEFILQIIHEIPAATPSAEQIEELRRLRNIVDLAPVLISVKDAA
jgi:PAS domain-containing protein